ncbi:MAG: DUF2922 family protein [Archaeoglobaceae archaeon]
MKRLVLVYRNMSEGRSRRITIPAPKSNLTSSQVEQAKSALKSLGLVSDAYSPDEGIIYETTKNVLVDLIQ